MRKYVVISTERDNQFVEATSFDINNLITINTTLFVPFYCDKELVGVASIAGLTGIEIIDWNVNTD